jgi:hypothetical protein
MRNSFNDLVTSLEQAIDMAKEFKGDSKEIDARFKVNIELDRGDETWNCYGVAISHRDILLYCEEGTMTFLLDKYGDKYTFELFSAERG